MLNSAASAIGQEINRGLRQQRLPFLIVYGPMASGKTALLESVAALLEARPLGVHVLSLSVDFRNIPWKDPSRPLVQLTEALVRSAAQRCPEVAVGLDAELRFLDTLTALTKAARQHDYWGILLAINHLDQLPNEGIRTVCRQLKILKENNDVATRRIGVVATSARSLYWLNDQKDSPFVGYLPVVLPAAFGPDGRDGICDSLANAIKQKYSGQLGCGGPISSSELGQLLINSERPIQSLRQTLLHLATSRDVAALVQEILQGPVLPELRSLVPDFDEYEETGLVMADRRNSVYQLRNTAISAAAAEALKLIQPSSIQPSSVQPILPDGSIGVVLRSVAMLREQLASVSGLQGFCGILHQLWTMVVVDFELDFYFRLGSGPSECWIRCSHGQELAFITSRDLPKVCSLATVISSKHEHARVATSGHSTVYWFRADYRSVPLLFLAHIPSRRGTAYPNETLLRQWHNLIADIWEHLARRCLFEYARHKLINWPEAANLEAEMKKKARTTVDTRAVFVVHGRDGDAKALVEDALRKLDLRPIPWNEAVKYAKSPSAFTLDIVKAGLQNAQAVVVIMSGDDEGRLRDDLNKAHDDREASLSRQPRQNVLIEAGMALALYPERTLLVRVGDLRAVSDFDGLNYVQFDGSPSSRNQLASRLKLAGCNVNTDGDWLMADRP